MSMRKRNDSTTEHPTENLPDDLFLAPAVKGGKGGSRRTLSFSKAPTVLLSFLANRYTRHLSQVYIDEFGVGAMDWRVLVMLAREPGSSVSHASRTIGIDKAAISRCMRRLEKMGLAKVYSVGHDKRKLEWTLTNAGGKLHDKMLTVSLRKQKELLSGLSERDICSLNKYLTKMLSNLALINQKND